MPASTAHLPHPRRAAEPNGTVHASRQPDLAIAQPGHPEELPPACSGVGEYGHGLTGRTVHWGCCPVSC